MQGREDSDIAAPRQSDTDRTIKPFNQSDEESIVDTSDSVNGKTEPSGSYDHLDIVFILGIILLFLFIVAVVCRLVKVMQSINFKVIPLTFQTWIFF